MQTPPHLTCQEADPLQQILHTQVQQPRGHTWPPKGPRAGGLHSSARTRRLGRGRNGRSLGEGVQAAQAEGAQEARCRTRPPAQTLRSACISRAVVKARLSGTCGRNFHGQIQTKAQMLLSSSVASFNGAPAAWSAASSPRLGEKEEVAEYGTSPACAEPLAPRGRGEQACAGSQLRAAVCDSHTPSRSHFLRILICENILCS